MTDDDTVNAKDVSTAVQTTSATSGESYKILGTIGAIDGLGVVGASTATSGAGEGVRGITEATGRGTDDEPVGVYGEATAVNTELEDVGTTYGVYGVSRGGTFNEGTPNSAGVKGEAAGDGNTRGVTGITAGTNPGAAGVFGLSNRFSGFSSGRGVIGRTDGYDGGAAGVEGEATAASGRVYGVRGVTASSNADTAGVYGVTSGGGYGVHSDADAKISGALEVTQTGASVYLDSNTVNVSDVETLVTFDNATVDYGQWNPNSNYRYVPPEAGDYRVDTAVEFSSTPDESTKLVLRLRRYTGSSGVLDAQTTDRVGWSNSSAYTVRLSKTLKGVGAGEGLYVQAFHGDSANDYTLATGDFATYLTVTRVG